MFQILGATPEDLLNNIVKSKYPYTNAKHISEIDGVQVRVVETVLLTAESKSGSSFDYLLLAVEFDDDTFAVVKVTGKIMKTIVEYLKSGNRLPADLLVAFSGTLYKGHKVYQVKVLKPAEELVSRHQEAVTEIDPVDDQIIRESEYDNIPF